MKIIIKDNLDRDSISERLICDGVSEYWGRIIVKFLNAAESDRSSNFFVLVSDNYELYVFEP